MRVPIRQIAPLTNAYRCRPDAVRRYVTMLREGQKPPAVLVIKQGPGERYRYRMFDGAHRLRAAKRLGQTTIEAVIVTAEN